MSGPFPTGYFVDAPTLNAMLLGWIDLVAFFGACVYVSADAPTFVFSVAADMTGLIEPGMRVRLTQTTDKFFIVTAVGAFSGGVTPITIYGGTDYTLANAAISAGAFSTHKKPFGFNASPLKWSQITKDTSNWAVSTPSTSTYYNPGSVSLVFPIGAWLASYFVSLDCNRGSAVQLDGYVSLSTANNSATDSDFTRMAQGAANSDIIAPLAFTKPLLVAAKTPYYLITQTDTASLASLSFRGDVAPTEIRAVCAYL